MQTVCIPCLIDLSWLGEGDGAMEPCTLGYLPSLEQVLPAWKSAQILDLLCSLQ